MKLVRDKKYNNLWRLRWPNGDVSVNTPNPEYKDGHYGFYNKSRAKELMRRNGIENYDRGVTYNNPLGRD